MSAGQPFVLLSDEDLAGQGRLTQRRRPQETPLPRSFLLLVGIITVGGLVLRLPSFRDSLSGDEISTYFIVSGHSLSQVLRLVESNQETSPPLYFMVAWATKGFFGNTAESIRLVSLVTGTSAIPLTFLLGLWTVGRRADTRWRHMCCLFPLHDLLLDFRPAVHADALLNSALHPRSRARA